MTFAKGKTAHVYLRVTDMKDNTIKLSDLKYVDDEVYEHIKNYTINASDLYLTIAGTIGSVGIVPNEVDGMNLTENAVKLTHISCIKEYLLYALLSTIAQEHFISRFHQVAQPKLSIETVSKTPIAMPPIGEQDRIVKEIKRCLAAIKIIEEEQTDLEITISQTKSRILDLAIHGKLVPQDPTDEPASELLKRINPKTEIACDNTHYRNLPKGWCLVKGKNLFEPMKSTRPCGTNFKYIDIDSIDNKKQRINKIKELKSEDAPSRASRYTEKDDIVFSMVRPYLRNIAKVTDDDCIASTGFYVCRTSKLMLPDFCYYLMLSDYVVNGLNQFMKGDNSPSINKSNIENWIYPLPPYKEQQRIVNAINKALTMLDTITANL